MNRLDGIDHRLICSQSWHRSRDEGLGAILCSLQKASLEADLALKQVQVDNFYLHLIIEVSLRYQTVVLKLSLNHNVNSCVLYDCEIEIEIFKLSQALERPFYSRLGELAVCSDAVVCCQFETEHLVILTLNQTRRPDHLLTELDYNQSQVRKLPDAHYWSLICQVSSLGFAPQSEGAIEQKLKSISHHLNQLFRASLTVPAL